MRGILSLMGALALCGPGLAQDIDCDAPQTQTDMTLCAQQDWQTADAALNEVYGQAVDWMQQTDAGLDAADQGAEEALRTGQRAWVVFRDNACLAEAWPFTGGSIQPMVQMGCLARLTWARVGDLQILTEQGG